MKITPWINVNSGAYRAYDGTCGYNNDNRVAFIGKTPRVRVRNANWVSENYPDHINWVERPVNGDGPDDEESRKWCDDMLKLLGYEE